MTDNRFALVEFQGDQLLTIFDGQTVRVAMKPLVERLGIDWSSQHKRMSRDPILSEGMVIMTIPSERGMQETITLPIDLMHGWLFTLVVSKVREDARERVIAYQRECYQVLHDYWVKGAAINPRAALASHSAPGEVLTLINALKKEANPAAQRLIYDMLIQSCAARQIEAPALADLAGQEADDWAEVRDRFEAALEMLAGLGISPNLHRKPNVLFAINLPEFKAVCAKHRIELPSDHALQGMLRRRPDFIHARAVNCTDGKSRHCWVFTRPDTPRALPPSAADRVRA